MIKPSGPPLAHVTLVAKQLTISSVFLCGSSPTLQLSDDLVWHVWAFVTSRAQQPPASTADVQVWSHQTCLSAFAQDPITEAEYEGYKQKLKAELVARGHVQQAATEIVSSLDFCKSTRRPDPPHTIMWYMKASGHKKKLRSIEDVAKLYQAGTQGV